MQTPVYDFLKQYARQNPVRMHMPGHKGQAPVPELQPAFAMDLTEITGADSLFEASGILAESQQHASVLYHTAGTFYSCGGSTLCIQTMLTLMKQEQRTIIAARTVHRSFLNACLLLDLAVTWVYPNSCADLVTGTYSIADFAAALQQAQQPACIYVTSPDYLGRQQDLAALAALCRTYDARLLVDNAHGAHLAFLPDNQHPIALGADLCCDSAHKMLPCLTGTAYLHTSRPEYAARIPDAMSLFGSTSPSYLLLLSLDLCNDYLEQHAKPDCLRTMQRAQALRQACAEKLAFSSGEPLHLTIDAAASGYTGFQLAGWLEQHQVYVEYADMDFLLLLLSPVTPPEDLDKLETLLQTIPFPKQPRQAAVCYLPHPERVCSIREAALSPTETIPVSESLGRICAAVKVPCPPAVPIVLSGEHIDAACIKILEKYGILEINVVQ